ncbi:MAG: helix-turn-helix transcriptional regulator [Holophagales bacterium]|nr:helix-turn-helix transcriptional regulator [Holophagales bacterium]
MGITERREREKEEVRRRILDAARELFARDGYEAVTMRKIAEAIEYSPTAIYLHFKDKESLVRELCMADFDSLAKAFQRIAREPDPLERLKKSGLAYADFALEHPNHYRLMFMTPDPAPAKDEEAAAKRKGNPEEDAYAFLVATVAEAIEKGLLRTELKDPHLVAQAAWAGVHGVISLHVAKGTDGWIDWKPLKKTVTLVVDSFSRGISK